MKLRRQPKYVDSIVRRTNSRPSTIMLSRAVYRAPRVAFLASQYETPIPQIHQPVVSVPSVPRSVALLRQYVFRPMVPLFLAVAVLLSNSFVLLSAFEAHVVNVTATIERPPGESLCPLSAEEGDILFFFADEPVLLSSRSISSATAGPYAVDIPVGSYDITLASYDNHLSKPNQSQPQESWYLILQNAVAVTIATTSAIGDLPEEVNVFSEVVDTNFVVSEHILSLLAFHAAHPDKSSANSVQPLCALFSPITEEVFQIQQSRAVHSVPGENVNDSADDYESDVQPQLTIPSGDDDEAKSSKTGKDRARARLPLIASLLGTVAPSSSQDSPQEEATSTVAEGDDGDNNDDTTDEDEQPEDSTEASSSATATTSVPMALSTTATSTATSTSTTEDNNDHDNDSGSGERDEMNKEKGSENSEEAIEEEAAALQDEEGVVVEKEDDGDYDEDKDENTEVEVIEEEVAVKDEEQNAITDDNDNNSDDGDETDEPEKTEEAAEIIEGNTESSEE